MIFKNHYKWDFQPHWSLYQMGELNSQNDDATSGCMGSAWDDSIGSNENDRRGKGLSDVDTKAWQEDKINW